MSRTAHMIEENRLLRAGLSPEVAGQLAAGIIFAGLLEKGSEAAMTGYAGQRAMSEAKAAAKAEQELLEFTGALTGDVISIIKAHGNFASILEENGFKATHTSSDFPKALAALRQRIIRQDTPVAMANWRSWIPSRLVTTQPDFKQIRGLNMSEMAGLKLRPEATDVQYTTVSFTADGYFMSNYERALKYTWEMWVNDEVRAWERALMKMGEAALRTEAIVIFNVILAGVSRSSETGVTTGSPTAARIAAASLAMSTRTITDADGATHEGEIMPTDIVYPTKWRDVVTIALGTQFTDLNNGAPNPAYRSVEPRLERLWGGVFASDWILFDNNIDWIEVSFLNDGEHNFAAGPATYTKMPDVLELPNQGSFDSHTLAVKVGHVLGAKITNTAGVLRNQGA